MATGDRSCCSAAFGEPRVSNSWSSWNSKAHTNIVLFFLFVLSCIHCSILYVLMATVWIWSGIALGGNFAACCPGGNSVAELASMLTYPCVRTVALHTVANTPLACQVDPPRHLATGLETLSKFKNIHMGNWTRYYSRTQTDTLIWQCTNSALVHNACHHKNCYRKEAWVRKLSRMARLPLLCKTFVLKENSLLQNIGTTSVIWTNEEDNMLCKERSRPKAISWKPYFLTANSPQWKVHLLLGVGVTL